MDSLRHGRAIPDAVRGHATMDMLCRTRVNLALTSGLSLTLHIIVGQTKPSFVAECSDAPLKLFAIEDSSRPLITSASLVFPRCALRL